MDRSALFLTHFPPVLNRSGSCTRVAALLRAVASRYRVTLVNCSGYFPEVEVNTEELPQGVDAYHRLRLQAPDGTPLTYSQVAGQIGALYESRPFELLFVFRVETTLYSLQLVRRCRRSYLDVDEMLSDRSDHFAELHRRLADPLAEATWRRRQSAIEVMERRNLRDFKQLIACSDLEMARLRALNPDIPCGVIPNTAPATTPPPPPESDSPFVFLFVGSLGYPPNEDATCWFATEIFPIIRQLARRPVEFRIVGSGENERIRCLGDLEGVRFLGYVPDIRTAYEQSHASVVPLRAGAGTRIKILESFSMNRPVVSTRLGAEGIPVGDGVELLLRDDPRLFAEACLELAASPQTRESLARNGLAYYSRFHTQEAATLRFQEIDDQWDQ